MKSFWGYMFIISYISQFCIVVDSLLWVPVPTATCPGGRSPLSHCWPPVSCHPWTWLFFLLSLHLLLSGPYWLVGLKASLGLGHTSDAGLVLRSHGWGRAVSWAAFQQVPLPPLRVFFSFWRAHDSSGPSRLFFCRNSNLDWRSSQGQWVGRAGPWLCPWDFTWPETSLMSQWAPLVLTLVRVSLYFFRRI